MDSAYASSDDPRRGWPASGLLALPALRDAAIDHFPPQSRWPEQRRDRLCLAPFLLSASVAFACAVVFLVVTNHGSRSCNESVVFDYWTAQRKAEGCKMYDGLETDLTLRLQGRDFPNLTVTCARGHQLLPDDRFHDNAFAVIFQPTSLPPAYSNYTQPVAITMLTARIEPVGLSFSVKLEAYFRFAEFDFLCEVAGFMLQPLAADVPHYAVVSINTDRVNWNNITDNLSVWSDPDNAKLRAAVLQSLYSPLMAVQEQLMDWAYDDFLDSRHIQHCVVCVPESAVSIAWIVLLGTLQAASTIHTLTGYCIRRWNRKLGEAEPQQLGQSEPSAVASTMPSATRDARSQRQEELQRGLLGAQNREDALKLSRDD